MRLLYILLAVSSLAIMGAVDGSKVGVDGDMGYRTGFSQSSGSDTILALWVMNEQLDTGDTWDAVDSPHTAWASDGEPDTMFVDDDASKIRFLSGRVGNTDAPYAYSSSYHRSLFVQESNWPVGYQVCSYVWFDLSLIPNNIDIISAELCYTSDQIATFSSDWLYAYADTFSTDNAWQTAPEFVQTIGTRYSVGNFEYQDKAAETPWSSAVAPTQLWRDNYWEHGIPSEPWKADVADGDGITLDVTRAVQLAKDNGKDIQGFQLMSNRSDEYFRVKLFKSWSAHTSVQHQPFFKVKYVEKANRGRWGGKDFVFSFQTDDQDTANFSYAEMIEGHGGKYTVYVRADLVDGRDNGLGVYNNSQKLDAEDLRTLMNSGHDIENHSRHHLAPWGMGEILADEDSVSVELDREWLVVDVLGKTIDDYDDHPLFAFPAGGYGARAVSQLDSLGYIMARPAGGMYPNTTLQQNPGWFDDGTFAFQQTDERRFLAWGDTVNMFTITNSHAAPNIVGTGSEPDSTIVNNVNNAFHWCWLNNQTPFSFFAHGYHGSYATSTIDGDELRLVLDTIEARGDTRIDTQKWVIEYWMNHHRPVDPPSWTRGATATRDIFRGQ